MLFRSIKSNQIEAARIAMTRYIKRGGKVWIKIFPDKPVTKTPAETRMGKGKGALEYWVAVVKPGRVMFEIAGVSARSVLQNACGLLRSPLATRTSAPLLRASWPSKICESLPTSSSGFFSWPK